MMEPEQISDPRPGAVLTDNDSGIQYFIDIQGRLRRMKEELEALAEFEEEPLPDTSGNGTRDDHQSSSELGGMDWDDISFSGILDDPSRPAWTIPSLAGNPRCTKNNSPPSSTAFGNPGPMTYNLPPLSTASVYSGSLTSNSQPHPTAFATHLGTSSNTNKTQQAGCWQPMLVWVPTSATPQPDILPLGQDTTFRPISPSPLTWPLPDLLQDLPRPNPTRAVLEDYPSSTRYTKK